MSLGEGSSGWLQCAQAKNLWHRPGKLIQQPRWCFWLLGALNLVGEAVNGTTSLWYQEKWEKCCKMQKQDTMELGVGDTVMPGSFHGGSGLWAGPWMMSSRENGGVGGSGSVGGGEWRRQGLFLEETQKLAVKVCFGSDWGATREHRLHQGMWGRCT